MKRETLLTLAVAALLVLNLGIMTYLFVSRRPSSEQDEQPLKGKKIDDLFITQLRLSEAQQEQFKSLKFEHRSAMQKRDAEYRSLVEQYFSLLRGTTLDTVRRDSLQKLLVSIHSQKVSNTFQHFIALKNICSPEQQFLFEQLIPELSHVLMQPPRRPRGGSPNDIPRDSPNNPSENTIPKERRN